MPKILPSSLSSSVPRPSRRDRGGFLARQRAALVAERKRLETLLQPINGHDDLERLADPLDEAARIGRQTTVDSLQALYRDQYVAVRLALDALADGSYGQCQACEVPISAKRLERIPWARLCIRCQTVQERQEQELAY